MSKPEPTERERRLAEQLRRNLRRRKTGGGEGHPTDPPLKPEPNEE